MCSDAERSARVISLDSLAKVDLRLVADLLSREKLIRFRPILGEAVRIFEVLWLEIGLQRAVQLGHHVVEAPALTPPGIEDSAFARFRRTEICLNHVINVDEIAPLLAGGENARPLAGTHLPRELLDHARELPLVILAGAINVAVSQPYNWMREFFHVFAG